MDDRRIGGSWTSLTRVESKGSSAAVFLSLSFEAYTNSCEESGAQPTRNDAHEQHVLSKARPKQSQSRQCIGTHAWEAFRRKKPRNPIAPLHKALKQATTMCGASESHAPHRIVCAKAAQQRDSHCACIKGTTSWPAAMRCGCPEAHDRRPLVQAAGRRAEPAADRSGCCEAFTDAG